MYVSEKLRTENCSCLHQWSSRGEHNLAVSLGGLMRLLIYRHDRSMIQGVRIHLRCNLRRQAGASARHASSRKLQQLHTISFHIDISLYSVWHRPRPLSTFAFSCVDHIFHTGSKGQQDHNTVNKSIKMHLNISKIRPFRAFAVDRCSSPPDHQHDSDRFFRRYENASRIS